jgi:hypothetical protein
MNVHALMELGKHNHPASGGEAVIAYLENAPSKEHSRPTGNVALSAESRRIKWQKWATEREYTFKAFNQFFCKCLILKKSTVCIGLHGGQHKYKIARLKVTKSSF